MAKKQIKPRKLKAAAEPEPVNVARDQYLPLENEHAAWLHETPEDFLHDSFTSTVLEAGVRCIKGKMKDGDGGLVECSYCFDRGKFTADAAQQWLAAKQITAAKFDPSKDDTYRQITASAPKQVLMHGTGTIRATAGAPKKLPTLNILAYTGGPLLLEGFRLPVIVDVSGVQTEQIEPTPVLKDHEPEQVVGHGQPTVKGSEIRISGVVSGVGKAAQEVLAANGNGFPWRASIGCELIGEAEYVPEGQARIVNGQSQAGPYILWPKSVLREVSLTGRGADSNSRVSIAAKAARFSTSRLQKGEQQMDFDTWLDAKGFKSEELSDTQRTSLQAAFDSEARYQGLQSDIDTALAAGVDKATKQITASASAEIMRLEAINKAHSGVAEAWGLDLKEHKEIRAKAAELRMKAIGDNYSAEKAELEFLRIGRPQKVISNTWGDNDAQPSVLEAAACRSCMMPRESLEKHFDPKTLEMADKHYRNIGLKRLLVEAASARGYQKRWIENDEDLRDVLHYALPPWSPDDQPRHLRAEFSTFSLPGIMSNLANKFLHQGFWAIESVWRDIALSRTMTDFKPHYSFRFSGDLTYEKLGPTGEIKHGTVGEVGYVNSLGTYAKMFTTTRQDIRNDDMGALSQLPQALGMGAAYALNEVFWLLWLSNTRVTNAITGGSGGTTAPTVTASTDTFWSAAHSKPNYMSGATTNLGVVALTAAKKMFLEQTKPDGKPLMIPPYLLLVPPALDDLAKQLFTSQYLAEIVLGLASVAAGTTKQIPTDNPHKGSFQHRTAAYLSTAYGISGSSDTAWWLLANPAILPCAEIGFLDGQQTPTIQSSEADFNVLGIQHRGFYDFGCALSEWRGSVMSKGAA